MGANRSAALLLSDPALRAIAREAFTALGYSVREVRCAEALDVVRAGELALLEIGPGGVSAEALAEACAGKLPSLAPPIVAAVPAGGLAEARAALGAGASSVIALPFDRDELAIRLEVVRRWAHGGERFREVLAQLPSRVMVFDGDGRLVFMNRSGAASTVDRLLAGPRIDDFPGELREAVLRAGRKAQQTGAPVDREAQVTGVWLRLRAIPLDPTSRRGGFALIADDISEHRRAEAELRASSTKAAALLDALPDVVFRVSAAGVLLDFRAERGNLVDLPLDRVVGSRLEEVFPPDLCQALRPAIELALSSQSVQRIEHSLNGSPPRDLEIRLVASGGDEVVAVVRDMTESKYVQQRLALADRLAALGSLSAGVAHEINNPLTYILIGIESVLKDLRRLAPDQPVGDRLDVLIERLHGAMEGARRVRRIVSDLRTFARADEEAEQLVDPRAVIDAALSMVDSQIRYRARLIREYGPLPQVLGNQDRLVQVFVNLLLNAAQSMPEAQASRNFIRLRTFQDEAGNAVIEVEDCGHGIASEDLGRVFDPFYTTKPIGEGTGLGLWICHSIVTGHRGSITVQSRVGEGTTFRVVLPPAPPAVEATSGGEGEVALEAPGGRILVIDDDEQVARSLGILFEGSDLTVLTSGRAAVDRLASGEEYDWIFCDLMMPDLSGMDVYEQVRRTGRGLEERFVFMTGGVFTPRARDFVARVPNPCLSKPFHPRQVVAALRQGRTPGSGGRS